MSNDEFEWVLRWAKYLIRKGGEDDYQPPQVNWPFYTLSLGDIGRQ